MSPAPQVEIVCDGNKRIGYGHIRRALTLSSQLTNDGVDVRLSGISEEAKLMLPLCQPRSEAVKVIIFDAPSGIDSFLSSAKADGLTSVTLDWFGNEIPDVNIAVFPHGEVRAHREKYIGFEYILIRDEIISLPIYSSEDNYKKNVLVALGGGDILSQGHYIASYLSKLGYNITLIEGHFSKKRKMSSEYKVLVTPPEFPKILQQSDWVVTNGGSCLFEAVFLGKAAYVLPQTEAEMRIASSFYENRAVLGIGINGIRGFNHHEIDQAHRNCLGLVDGNGAKRISEIVRGLL